MSKKHRSRHNEPRGKITRPAGRRTTRLSDPVPGSPAGVYFSADDKHVKCQGIFYLRHFRLVTVCLKCSLTRDCQCGPAFRYTSRVELTHDDRKDFVRRARRMGCKFVKPTIHDGLRREEREEYGIVNEGDSVFIDTNTLHIIGPAYRLDELSRDDRVQSFHLTLDVSAPWRASGSAPAESVERAAFKRASREDRMTAEQVALSRDPRYVLDDDKITPEMEALPAFVSSEIDPETHRRRLIKRKRDLLEMDSPQNHRAGDALDRPEGSELQKLLTDQDKEKISGPDKSEPGCYSDEEQERVTREVKKERALRVAWERKRAAFRAGLPDGVSRLGDAPFAEIVNGNQRIRCRIVGQEGDNVDVIIADGEHKGRQGTVPIDLIDPDSVCDVRALLVDESPEDKMSREKASREALARLKASQDKQEAREQERKRIEEERQAALAGAKVKRLSAAGFSMVKRMESGETKRGLSSYSPPPAGDTRIDRAESVPIVHPAPNVSARLADIATRAAKARREMELRRAGAIDEVLPD